MMVLSSKHSGQDLVCGSFTGKIKEEPGDEPRHIVMLCGGGLVEISAAEAMSYE